MYVVAVGNAFEGLTLVGPFDSFDEAEKYTDAECVYGEWNIVKVEVP